MGYYIRNVCSFENNVRRVCLIKRGNVYHVVHLRKGPYSEAEITSTLRVGGKFEDAKQAFLLAVMQNVNPDFFKYENGDQICAYCTTW